VRIATARSELKKYTGTVGGQPATFYLHKLDPNRSQDLDLMGHTYMFPALFVKEDGTKGFFVRFEVYRSDWTFTESLCATIRGEEYREIFTYG
jgi:hypothetical protein